MPEYIDHIDRDTLNNDISNLREATSSQNQANKTKSDNKTSAYKGVSFTTITNLEGKKYEYWTSLIYIEGKSKYLGSFKSQEHAALRYNKEAVKIFGEFAHLNIIQP